jgi:hypothetical protein
MNAPTQGFVPSLGQPWKPPVKLNALETCAVDGGNPCARAKRARPQGARAASGGWQTGGKGDLKHWRFSDDASAPTPGQPCATDRMAAPIRVVLTSVTVTGSGNQSRGENGYWNVSKMVLLSELAAHLESGRPRIINTPMSQELTAELNSFEVDFTPAGNMRVDVRSKDHHGDLLLATVLALWSAVRSKIGTDLRPAANPRRSNERPPTTTPASPMAPRHASFLVSLPHSMPLANAEQSTSEQRGRAVIFWAP